MGQVQLIYIVDEEGCVLFFNLADPGDRPSYDDIDELALTIKHTREYLNTLETGPELSGVTAEELAAHIELVKAGLDYLRTLFDATEQIQQAQDIADRITKALAA